jgi:hypothetical protein
MLLTHAGGATGGGVTRAMPHGAVQVSPERRRQSASGSASSAGWPAPALRTTGRVEPDENRMYPIVAAVSDGSGT